MATRGGEPRRFGVRAGDRTRRWSDRRRRRRRTEVRRSSEWWCTDDAIEDDREAIRCAGDVLGHPRTRAEPWRGAARSVIRARRPSSLSSLSLDSDCENPIAASCQSCGPTARSPGFEPGILHTPNVWNDADRRCRGPSTAPGRGATRGVKSEQRRRSGAVSARAWRGRRFAAVRGLETPACGDRRRFSDESLGHHTRDVSAVGTTARRLPGQAARAGIVGGAKHRR